MIIDELYGYGDVRKISAARKRKLRKLGVYCWWSDSLESWVWASREMADPGHERKGRLKHFDSWHFRRRVAK